jgi:hypothetical protein
MNALVISLDGRGHGMLALDDKDLSNAINGFTLTSRAGQASVLELDIVPYLTTVTAEVTVTIPEATRAALVALGWTPPRPVCPDCGPLSLNEDGLITAHHCPTYSNLPSIDGIPHA